MAYEPVLVKHVGEQNSYTLDFYLKNQRGYEGLRKALTNLPRPLYTAPDCGPCDSARAWLRRRGAPYQEIVVDTEVDAEEFKRRVGTTSVPVMTLGRTPHLGFNEGAWSSALIAAGYPAQIVLPPTYRPEPPKPILPPDASERPAANSPAPKSQ
jgi:glutaredoxin